MKVEHVSRLAFDDRSHAATPLGVCLSSKNSVVSTALGTQISSKANFELAFPHSCSMEKAEYFYISALRV